MSRKFNRVKLESHAYDLIKRGKRRCLGRLLARHRFLKSSDTAMLIFAAIWHNRSMITWLLGRGVSPDCRMGAEDNTPLMHLASMGDCEMIQILLRFGANPNLKNQSGETALGFAVVWNHPRCAGLLISEGSDVHTTSDFRGKLTLLDSAIISGFGEVSTILRTAGAKRFDELG